MSKVSARRMYEQITHLGVLKQAWENGGIVVYAQRHPLTRTVFRTFGTMDYFQPVLLAKPYDIIYVKGHPLPVLVAVLLCKYFFLLKLSAVRRQDLKMVWSAMDTLMLAPVLVRPDVQPYLDAAVSKYYTGRKQKESKRVREFIVSTSRTIDGRPITLETSLARVRKDRMPHIKIWCLHLFAQAKPKMVIGTQILDLPVSLRNFFVKIARMQRKPDPNTQDTTQAEKDMKQAYLFAYDPTQIYSRCGTQTVPSVIPFAKDISCSVLKPGNEQLQEDCSTFMMASGLHVSIFDYIRPWNDKRFMPLSMDDFDRNNYFVPTRAEMQEENSLVAFEKRMTASEGASSSEAAVEEEEHAPSSSFDSDFWEEQRHLATEQKNTQNFWGDVSLDDLDVSWMSSSQESQINTYDTLDPNVLDLQADALDVQVSSAPNKPGKPDEPATSTPSTPTFAVC